MQEAPGGGPDLVETARVGAADGERVVAALDDADGEEQERVHRGVLLAGFDGQPGVVVRIVEAHPRVRPQDPVAHAQEEVAPLRVERHAGFQLLDLALDPGHGGRGLVVARIQNAERGVAHEDGGPEQEAETEEGQRLPSTSLADHDRPRPGLLPRTRVHRPGPAVVEIVQHAPLLIQDHGLPLPGRLGNAEGDVTLRFSGRT